MKNKLVLPVIRELKRFNFLMADKCQSSAYIAAQELRSFGRVQARCKTEYSDLFMEASFQHKSKHSILHTYLENRILNKNELNIQNQNIKTSEAIQEIVWKKQTCKCESVYKQT